MYVFNQLSYIEALMIYRYFTYSIFELSVSEKVLYIEVNHTSVCSSEFNW